MSTNSQPVKTRHIMFKSDAEPVLYIMILLIVIGAINIFSSSYIVAGMDFDDPFFFLKRHLMWLGVGFVCFFICRRMNYMKWRGLMVLSCIVTITLLALVLVIGLTINGATRWLPLGPFTFQPSEFAKLIAVLLSSFAISASLKDKYNPHQRLIVPYLAIMIMAVLVNAEPDFGTACIIAGVPILMWIITMTRPATWPLMALVGGGGAIAYAMTADYRRERLLTMFDPWSDALGSGYQVVQSLATIGSGGVFGMGFGDGVSKYDYLPEAHTDFAFAIFSQEHGFCGVLCVFMLFMLLIIYASRIAGNATTLFGQLLALGITILIMGQATVNLAMVSGMFAVVGVPLPFISYGGSSLITMMMAIGMLLSIADRSPSPVAEAIQHNQVMPDDVMDNPPGKRPHLRLVKR